MARKTKTKANGKAHPAPKAEKAKKQATKAAAPAAPEERQHNLSDDQRKALLFLNMKPIRALKLEMASVSGKLRAAYKTAKSDGFTKQDIDFAFALENDKDDQVAERRRREQQLALWMQHPIGEQPDMFDQQPDRTPLSDRAFAQGKTAGMEGKPMASPYDVGLEAGQRWIEGWHAGQAAIFDIQKLRDAGEFDGPTPLEQAIDKTEEVTA